MFTIAAGVVLGIIGFYVVVILICTVAAWIDGTL